jgi:excisionase family DNA binding protein
MEIQERAVYTTAEAAQILKLSPITVERKIRRGEIPATKMGKEYRLLGINMLSLFGWKENMWNREYRAILDEMRAEGKRKGITEQDILETIKEVRKEERDKTKDSN